MSEAPGAFAATLAPVHRAGWPFVAGALLVGVAAGFLWAPLFWLGAAAATGCAYFFRDPARVTPIAPEIVVSPADGRIQRVGPRLPPAELGLGDRPLPCVSVFLSVLDVHVNRTPVAGRVVTKIYRPGLFLNAALDKASTDNERQGWVIEAEGGASIGLVQIAGLVARRIVTFVEAGALLPPGERVGLIRFGSRCDVYLPDGTTPLVIEGQRAIGGETVLARLGVPAEAPHGRRS